MMNDEVTRYLNELKHPLISDIHMLRQYILSANAGLSENIKWNGPNYQYQGADRITMRIHPPKQLQVIFHRGAKTLKHPEKKLINDESGLLSWKTNDRAVMTFKNGTEILSNKVILVKIINDWLQAAGH